MRSADFELRTGLERALATEGLKSTGDRALPRRHGTAQVELVEGLDL